MGALEEGLPAFGNLLRAARRPASGHEDGLAGEEGRKRGRVAVGHGFGEGDFGLTYLLLELRVRLGSDRASHEQQGCTEDPSDRDARHEGIVPWW